MLIAKKSRLRILMFDSRPEIRNVSSGVENVAVKNKTFWEAFLEKMSFICMRMKKHFQIKGWALNLVLIQRPGVSRKWRDPVHFHDTHARLLVFSVTPFKIDQNQNENRSIDKVQNLGNERRYISKDPRQDSGNWGIFRIRDIRRNVLHKLIEICMETTCWCSHGEAPTWRTETNRNICYRV